MGAREILKRLPRNSERSTMDIVAHTLWTALAIASWRRRKPITGPMAAAALSMAALPDAVQLLPIALWWLFGNGTLDALQAYAMASPGVEPSLPPLVRDAAHHLHCALHSAPIAAAVSLALWPVLPKLWAPLFAWWLHIVVDVFTHSADYYAVPVLYPFTYRGFDGVAWNAPWFMALNYVALATVSVWLAIRWKRRDGTPSRAPSR
jgi:hypothetical protein